MPAAYTGRTMHRFLTVTLGAAVLLAPHPLHAQDSDQPRKTQPPRIAELPKGSITGTVICTDTRKPARGAVVVADSMSEGGPGGSRTLTTRVAMDGSYTLEHVPPGDYAVVGFLPGYVTPVDDLMVSDMDGDTGEKTLHERMARSGVVTVRNTASTLDLTLERGAAVSGRVSYSDGAPATQISIDMESTEAKPPKTNKPDGDISVGAMMRAMFTHQTMSTDDLGHFRISGIHPGKYRIAAVEAITDANDNMEGLGFLTGLGADPQGMRMYSGDTLHKNQAKVYELRAGDEITEIEIMLPVNAFHVVKGTVNGKDGRPLNNGRLELKDDADASLVFQTKLLRDGTFQFPTVPNGTYTLSASGVKFTLSPVDSNEGAPVAPAGMDSSPRNGSMGIIVKDADITDVLLTLESPLATSNPDASPAAQPDAAPHI